MTSDFPAAAFLRLAFLLLWMVAIDLSV